MAEALTGSADKRLVLSTGWLAGRSEIHSVFRKVRHGAFLKFAKRRPLVRSAAPGAVRCGGNRLARRPGRRSQPPTADAFPTCSSRAPAGLR